MKGKRIFLIVLMLFALLFPLPCVVVSAEPVEESLDGSVLEQIEKLDLADLEEYVKTLENFSDRSVVERLLAYIKGDAIDYDGFFKSILSALFENVKALFPAFSCIAAISLLCGVLSALKSGFIGKMTGETVFLVGFSATLVPLLSVLTECFSTAKESVEQMRLQMELVFPLLLTLTAASGGTVSAAIFQPTVAFLSTTIVQIVTLAVFPITVTVIAFSIVGNFSGELKLKRFSAFFKSMNKWIIGVCVSSFGMFFTVQGLTSAAYDGVARRAAKYAIGTGVPILGGFLAGGFDLALAGSILIKNSLGVFGIVMMLSVVLEPLLTLISVNLLLRLTAAITEPIGDSRISDFLGETADHLNYCSAGLLFVGFLYLVVIVLMICSAEVIL